MIKPLSPDTPVDRERHYLPARMLNEFAYCPRLFYLEHVDGLFAHNADTREGQARHQSVDKRTDALRPGGESTDALAKDEQSPVPETIHARSVTLASDSLGILAKLDLVEATGNEATPIDYKRGSPKVLDDGSLGAWDPERVQLCVQALVLREHGYRCESGILFFWETRQRVRIAIDAELLALTETTIAAARKLLDDPQLPKPLVDSPKCPRCSLVGICLPDETHRCQQSADETWSHGSQRLLFDIGPQLGTANRFSGTSEPARRLITARDEKRPLYLNTQGYSVGVSHGVLQVKEQSQGKQRRGKVIQEARLNDVNQVNLFGSVQISTQAVQALLGAEIPLVYFSYGGWFHGMTQAVGLKNILWRREQFRLADRDDFCLSLARKLVVGKIRNQRTLLMRNHIEPPTAVLNFLKSMIWQAERAQSQPELLGLEGIAARVYFENFSGMLKVEADDNPIATIAPDEPASTASWLRFDFQGRNRRPPCDPVNALLSLGYSLLAKDLTIACTATGLDPYLGYYHQPRFGRPALALDLMEPFRALIVDSAVLSAINQRMVTPRDFVSAGNSVNLTIGGRKAFFRAYEQRMDQLVTHPLFGYRVSYRRLLEIQTRLLARVLLGELREYPVFITR